jgi:formamidopyrimidine-DNA glycosylase
MPELPEVETIVRGLRNQILGSVINHVEQSDKKMRFPCHKDFSTIVLGQKIIEVSRRAKYILLQLANCDSIIIHLGMSGRVLLSKKIKYNKHYHLKIYLKSAGIITLYDPRRFGFYGLLSHHGHLIDKSGLEPLAIDLNAFKLYEIFIRTERMIKDVLMDGSKIVGIGNIYASEILFMSRIHPARKANSISMVECEQLIFNIRYVLNKAIQYGGSTLKDYRKDNGQLGEFQNHFLIYGKKNQPCIECHSRIESIKIQNRASYYCVNCQQLI